MCLSQELYLFLYVYFYFYSISICGDEGEGLIKCRVFRDPDNTSGGSQSGGLVSQIHATRSPDISFLFSCICCLYFFAYSFRDHLVYSVISTVISTVHRGENPKLSGQQLFPRKKNLNDSSETVSRDKPKKMRVCLTTLPKNAYSMFLSYNTIDILIQHTLFQWSQKWEMIWKSSDSLKPSGKWGMIWKSLDSCEKIRKMGNDLEKSGQL